MFPKQQTVVKWINNGQFEEKYPENIFLLCNFMNLNRQHRKLKIGTGICFLPRFQMNMSIEIIEIFVCFKFEYQWMIIIM